MFPHRSRNWTVATLESDEPVLSKSWQGGKWNVEEDSVPANPVSGLWVFPKKCMLVGINDGVQVVRTVGKSRESGVLI